MAWWPFRVSDETLQPRRAFPLVVTLDIVPNVPITLHGDGTYTGDRDAFLLGIESASVPSLATTRDVALVWMLANAIRSAKRRDTD